MSDSMHALVSLMKALRDPKTGCPWDKKQTFESIVPHTLEEAYELAWAIEHQDKEEIKLEVGDLLFQVVFYCQLASEKGWFDLVDVCHALERKLTRRHPHVFGDEKAQNPEQVMEIWETVKDKERNQACLLEDIPRNLPSLSRAQKIQKRVTRVGFDWESIDQVMAKLEEEVAELKEVLGIHSTKAEEELGDLMFTCCNLARWLGVDAEQLLRQATDKFTQRFNKVEQKVKDSLKPWDHYDLEALEEFWGEAKNDE